MWAVALCVNKKKMGVGNSDGGEVRVLCTWFTTGTAKLGRPPTVHVPWALAATNAFIQGAKSSSVTSYRPVSGRGD